MVARQLGYEVARATLGNRAQIVDGFLAAQANTVVGDGQRFGGLVKAHLDLELGIRFIKRRVIQRFEPQLVAGVRGIGDQLAQEDLRIGIKRVRDQLEQLGDFSLEGKSLFLSH